MYVIESFEGQTIKLDHIPHVGELLQTADGDYWRVIWKNPMVKGLTPMRIERLSPNSGIR